MATNSTRTSRYVNAPRANVYRACQCTRGRDMDGPEWHD
jgi:hypothetical protein